MTMIPFKFVVGTVTDAAKTAIKNAGGDFEIRNIDWREPSRKTFLVTLPSEARMSTNNWSVSRDHINTRWHHIELPGLTLQFSDSQEDKEGTLDIVCQPGKTIKYCPTCKQNKPATTEYWHPKKGGKLGLNSECRECWSKRMEEYHNRPEIHEKNKKRMREYSKEYNARPEVKSIKQEQRKERHALRKAKQHNETQQTALWNNEATT